MVDKMHEAFRFMLDLDPDELSAIGGVAGFAFQIGFEAAEQFGRAT